MDRPRPLWHVGTSGITTENTESTEKFQETHCEFAVRALESTPE